VKKLLYILFFISSLINAQNRNTIWCFGDSAGIDFSDINNPVPFFSVMDGRGSCVSIADSSGNLLFYSDTWMYLTQVIVWNALHDTLQNANDSIGSDGYYNELQTIPFPYNSSKYYLFNTGVAGYFDGIFYSVIDMDLDSGRGGITEKFQNINTSRIADCLQAVKHGNGRDWWLITKMASANLTRINRFYVYLITPTGISSPTTYDFGNSFDRDFAKIIFNNKLNRMMCINLLGYMTEFDFDRCNGTISNPNTIFNEDTIFPYTQLFWEGAYSPNDSLFYLSSTRYTGVDTSYLMQFNLSALDIPASCDTLARFSLPIALGAVRLAPDDKIYVSCAYQSPGVNSFPYADTMRNYINENLGVINFPNNSGSACDFQPFSFYLGGKRTYYGLPYNPNYQLPALLGSACDSLTVGTSSTELKIPELNIFYNPENKIAFINAKSIEGKNYTLTVLDLTGRILSKQSGNCINQEFTRDLDCSALANSIYIVSFQTEKLRLTVRFIKE
jgi:hypothetical protein